MKPYSIIFFILFLFSGCNEKEKEVTDRSIIMPEIKLTPLQKTVVSALVSIVKKDIELSGDRVNTIKIEGMEIIKISKRDYYIQEMNEQQVNFQSYLQYLRASSNKIVKDQDKLQESMRKHDAVIAYLMKVIKTSSIRPEMFKVVYYAKAATKNLKYNQQQTTFLDKQFKKIVSDYGFLNK
jgi:hypothetical protein